MILSFGKLLLNPVSEKHLHKLSLISALAKLERVARKLLRHGARPLGDFSAPVVRNRGTNYPHVVHSIVLEKLVVLRGDNGLHHRRRDLIQRNRIAILNENLAELLAVAVVNHRGRFHALQLRQVELPGPALELRAEIHPHPPAHEGRNKNEARRPIKPRAQKEGPSASDVFVSSPDGITL